ncbi:MAG: OmpA family protein [Planctomycetota bacterium]
MKALRVAGSAVLLVGFAGGLGCVSQQQYEALRRDYDTARDDLNEAKRYAESLEARNAELDKAQRESQDELARNRKSYEDQLAALQALAEKEKSAKASEDWEVIPPGPGERALTYRLRDAATTLFEPGSDKISARGKDVLGRLAAELKLHDLEICIEGHTDSDPVVVHEKDFPLGNMQLSMCRALSVYGELLRLGLPESRFSLAGFGPNKPVGGDRSDKKSNRRVDVKVVALEEHSAGP